MLKKALFAALVSVAALGACSATAQDTLAAVEPAARMPAPQLATCEIRTRRTEIGVEIQGRASADSDIDGEYELTITKSGANDSETNQSGPVSIEAGHSVTFGESEISLERGSHLRAVLTLRDADGVICRETLTL